MIDRRVTSAWSTDARRTGVAVDAVRRQSANIRPAERDRRLAGRPAGLLSPANAYNSRAARRAAET